MLLKKYSYKFKTIDELRKILGGHPRDNKVVMCHGVFDVVHPGHLRHLLYAKGKADILVASLTADKHINKGKYRPHVPQDLRAANLAAYELVDYVVIDKNPTPHETIETLQPDLFAKGYEYMDGGIHEKTQEEEKIVSQYGGKILFTPGDYVYSSSKFISMNEPDIKLDKLATLLDSNKLRLDDLFKHMCNFNGVKVHIVGDTIVDGFMYTSMIGGQTKTPTVSVLYESQKDYIGGAAIVAQHMQAAGAEVTFTTLLGEDERKQVVLDKLHESGIKVNAIIDATRPTTYKNAIITGGYRLLKVDTLDNSSMDDSCLEQFVDKIRDTETDVIVFSDFRHGIFNKRTLPSLLNAIPKDVYKIADSQVASRWGNITEFKHFDLITPNEREARFALADQDMGIRQLANDLYDLAQCKVLIMKLGERGLLTCCNADHESLDSYVVSPSFVENLVDAVGAGDALLAYAGLALAKGASPVMASILGSLAAACECEVDGNIPITPELLKKKINSLKSKLEFPSVTVHESNAECA